MATNQTFALAALLGIGGWLVITSLHGPLSAEQAPADSYSPVTPPAAIHAALDSQLKVVRNWLDEKDFLSAQDAAQSMLSLIHLASRQSSQDSWRQKCSTLQAACSRLQSAAQGKDATACTKQIEECALLIGEMAKGLPADKKVIERNFKPVGSMKTWMLLMDGSYVDAKSAKSSKELENLANSIAEEANAVQFMRNDARWRKAALEVREAALLTAKEARTEKMGEARIALKNVYRRCEACHEAYKR